MTYDEVLKELEIDNLRSFELVSRDATLSGNTTHAVWTECARLVMAHPTDPKAPPIEAPRDGRYRAID